MVAINSHLPKPDHCWMSQQALEVLELGLDSRHSGDGVDPDHGDHQWSPWVVSGVKGVQLFPSWEYSQPAVDGHSAEHSEVLVLRIRMVQENLLQGGSRVTLGKGIPVQVGVTDQWEAVSQKANFPLHQPL